MQLGADDLNRERSKQIGGKWSKSKVQERRNQSVKQVDRNPRNMGPLKSFNAGKLDHHSFLKFRFRFPAALWIKAGANY